MINRFEQFTSSISSIYRYIQKIERDEMEKYGLRGSYAQYLLAMDRFPEGITASVLCEICDKDKAAVSRIISETISKGLVTREVINDNLYRATIKLTAEGKKAAQFVRERAKIAVEIAGNGLSDPNRKTLYATLNLIASNLQTICKEGIPDNE